MSVGISEIDEEHKKLVELIGQLEEAALTKQEHAAIGDVVRELLMYAAFHFQHEERLMAEASFQGTEQHKAIHNRFIDTAAALKTDFDLGREQVTEKTLQFLSDWLSEHIMVQDKEFAAAVLATA